MKTILFLLMLPLCAVGQNYSVTLWSSQPTNCQERIDGIPLTSHVGAKTFNIGASTTVTPPAILMTWAQLQECIRTNAVAVALYQSNVTWKADNAMAVKKEVIRAIYAQIPQAISNAQWHKDQWDIGTTFNNAQLQTWARKNNEATLRLLQAIQKAGPFLMELREEE